MTLEFTAAAFHPTVAPTISAANTKGFMYASILNNKNHKKRSWLCALMLVFLGSFFLAACGGGPSPVERAARLPGDELPQTPQISDADTPQAVAPLQEETADQEPVVIALMLPLSGSEGDTGQALLRAATIALFDAYDPRLKLLPMDTEADPAVAERRAQQAIEAGASVVLGPLLAANVEAVGEILAPTGIPVIGFSNDSTVAEPGRFIMGFLPEAEVKRVVDYALAQGLSNFGALVPQGRYGNRIRASFGDAVAESQAVISAIESYPPDAAALFEPVKRLARYDERRDDARREVRFLRSLGDDVTDEIAAAVEDAEVMEGVNFDAVLVPEGGALMRTLAPLLPFYEIDPNRVKLLGTGLWNDDGLLGEPPLQGAWFAAPDPTSPKAFLARYEKTYSNRPPRLATLAYDAMSLVARLAREPIIDKIPDGGDPGQLNTLSASDSRFSLARFMTNEGFVGVDGLFRFLADGTVERSLAVLEVHRSGFKVVDPAPDSFPAFGYALKN